MARIIDNKYIFIHAAKTGGTFFREALNRFGVPNWELGKKHSTLIESGWIKEMELTPIMFIRHPVSWYRSRWRFAKMTYFDQKMKYMPEAQEHWMARVWDDNYIQFVRNTLKAFPLGVATEYFERMADQAPNNMHLWKYEELTNKTFDGLRYLFGKPEVTLDEVQGMPRTLESSQIYYDELPIDLEYDIMETELLLMKHYK